MRGYTYSVYIVEVRARSVLGDSILNSHSVEGGARGGASFYLVKLHPCCSVPRR